MKRIIDVEKDYYETIRYNVEHGQEYKPFEIIANSIPAANLEYRSFMEGYMAGCEKAKKCYERPQGEWIALYENNGTPKGYKCPYCDDEPQIINTNFCPNCGAEMKGGKEEC